MPTKQLAQPENDEEEIQSESHVNKVIYFPEGKHIWRQQGYYLVCRECVLHHAVYIGEDKIMIGEDKDGKPELISRDKYEDYFKKK